MRGFETKLCVLPSPIDGFVMYGIMALVSVLWIVGVKFRWRRETREGEYIELDNLAKDEENTDTEGNTRTRRHRIWRRIVEECASMMATQVMCLVILQIIL